MDKNFFENYYVKLKIKVLIILNENNIVCELL